MPTELHARTVPATVHYAAWQVTLSVPLPDLSTWAHTQSCCANVDRLAVDLGHDLGVIRDALASNAIALWAAGDAPQAADLLDTFTCLMARSTATQLRGD